jgi:S1-C subfamily serine protease
MNPERALEDRETRLALLRALTRFATSVGSGADRRDALTTAGLAFPTLRYDSDAFSFATSLTALLGERPLAADDVTGHPLPQLLGFVLAIGPEHYGLNTDDVELCARLIAQCDDRLGALRARRSVGKVENERQQGLGTGVLVGPALLLTCHHILTKTGAERAWVRFGYKTGADGRAVAPGTRYALDLAGIPVRGGGPRPDFVLIPVIDARDVAAVDPVAVEVNSGERVRLIHHPLGQPAVVSEPGQVLRVAEDYLLHDVPTADGSSGAPIFNADWNLVALHRGQTPNAIAGTAEGVPLHAFRQELQPHLS